MQQTYYVHNQTNKHNWIGIAGSFIFHAIILLALYFFVLVPPNPPWEEQGMMMSLGEPNMGGPSETPIENPQPNETYTPITEQTEQPELSQNTDPDVDVVAKDVPKKPEKRPTLETPVERPKEQIELPKKPTAKSLFKRNTTASENQGGRGDGPIPGNEGEPDGDPNGVPGGRGTGTSGDGTGGKGFSYSLYGRRISRKPNISSTSNDVGIVVVNITVDRNGNVTKAEPGARGSTTLVADKLEKAKQAALSTKFSPKTDGPEEQYGTMTVNFTFE